MFHMIDSYLTRPSLQFIQKQTFYYITRIFRHPEKTVLALSLFCEDIR